MLRYVFRLKTIERIFCSAIKSNIIFVKLKENLIIYKLKELTERNRKLFFFFISNLDSHDWLNLCEHRVFRRFPLHPRWEQTGIRRKNRGFWIAKFISRLLSGIFVLIFLPATDRTGQVFLDRGHILQSEASTEFFRVRPARLFIPQVTDHVSAQLYFVVEHSPISHQDVET